MTFFIFPKSYNYLTLNSSLPNPNNLILIGNQLPDDLFNIGNRWLGTKSPFFIIATANLRLGDTSFFPPAYLDLQVCKNMSPSNWWAAVADYQRLPKGLSSLAQTLMKLPASSAGIERCFSALGNIMSKKRSRLEVDKGVKLCFIYQHYRNKNKEEVYIDEEDLD
jgi:hypothetical protein